MAFNFAPQIKTSQIYKKNKTTIHKSQFGIGKQEVLNHKMMDDSRTEKTGF